MFVGSTFVLCRKHAVQKTKQSVHWQLTFWHFVTTLHLKQWITSAFVSQGTRFSLLCCGSYFLRVSVIHSRAMQASLTDKAIVSTGRYFQSMRGWCFQGLLRFLQQFSVNVSWLFLKCPPLRLFFSVVQEMGFVEVLKVNPKMVQWDGSVGEGVELTVRSKVALGDAYIGCSIAVNGVCLTAISFDDEQVR